MWAATKAANLHFFGYPAVRLMSCFCRWIGALAMHFVRGFAIFSPIVGHLAVALTALLLFRFCQSVVNQKRSDPSYFQSLPLSKKRKVNLPRYVLRWAAEPLS